MRGGNHQWPDNVPDIEGKPVLKGYIYVLFSILLVTVAQLSMKWGALQLPAWQADFTFLLAHPLPLLVIMAGIVFYMLSLICWLAALHSTPLSVAYPLLSTSYALVYLLAVNIPVFAESLKLRDAAGVTLIILGAVLVGIRSK